MLEAFARIHCLLQARRAVSTQALERELEVSRSTVLRYIRGLQDRFGADIVYDASAGGYRYAGEPVALPPPMLTEGDLLALYVALPILAQYRGTALEGRFAASFKKITALLPERIKGRLLILPERVEARGRVPAHEDADRFARVFDAVHRDLQLELIYYSAHRGVTSTRTVDPFALCVVNGRWYLIGHDHVRDRVLKFALDRIWSAKETGKGFERPVQFNVAGYLEDAFGIYQPPDDGRRETQQIRVRFDAHAARYVRETVWHPSQTLDPAPDGTLVLTLRVRGTIEVEQFVLAWGEHAEVLDPTSLRDRLRDRLSRALARYESAR